MVAQSRSLIEVCTRVMQVLGIHIERREGQDSMSLPLRLSVPTYQAPLRPIPCPHRA
jgi:hypothetical protein